MDIDSATLNTFLAALTALILAIIAWFNKQRTDIAKTSAAQVTTAPIVVAAAPTPSGTNWLSVKITPTLLYGLKSPAPITFRIEATQPQPDHPGVTGISINWDDGTKQDVQVINGYAEVAHIFTFEKTNKYTGWTFNPIFTLHGSDGSTRVFNEEGTSVEIGIET